MSARYTCVVDRAVVEFFSSRTRREREELLRVFDRLAAAPYQRGDYFQRTAAGRELQVKRVGPWLLTFWPDDPVLELRIVDVKRLAA